MYSAWGFETSVYVDTSDLADSTYALYRYV